MGWYLVTIRTVFGKEIEGVREYTPGPESPFSHFYELAIKTMGSYTLRGLDIEDLDMDDPRVRTHLEKQISEPPPTFHRA